MNKYDFGDNIRPGSTMEWAFKNIIPNSTVLEIGAAVGTLVKNLKEQKNCTIDIVEIDKTSGKKAAQYARNSCIGLLEGDAEKDVWYSKLQDKKYDYIVILDVLEHLKFPLELLSKVKTLLSGNGVLLLSVPNIAHNSIIIDLMNNRFNYTELGLLDKTHVHFYTHESLCQLLKRVNLYPFKKEVVQLRVGENEVNNTYKDIPKEVEAFLRTRDYSDVYQFLFQVKIDNGEPDVPLKADSLPYTLYKFEILNTESDVVYQKFINPKNRLSIRFTPDFSNSVIRVNPLDAMCIIKNLEIYAGKNLELVPLEIIKSNAAISDNMYIFTTDDPQFFVRIPENTEYITVTGNFLTYGSINFPHALEKMWERILFQQAQIEDYKGQESSNQKIMLDNQILLSANNELQLSNQKILLDNQVLESRNNELQLSLAKLRESFDLVKSKWWYKLFNKN